MRTKSLTICIFLILMISFMISSRVASQGQWITDYKVRDLKTRAPVEERFAGSEYNVTLILNVTISVPYATLRLNSHLERPAVVDRYWELHSKSYPGINLSKFNPNQNYVEFNQVKGILIISLYGKVPEGITKQEIDGVILHKVTRYTVLELIGPNNALFDKIYFDVIDAEIKEYRNLLQSKENILASARNSRISSKYIELLNAVIDRAKLEADNGYIDKANGLLNMLPTSIDGLPKEPSPSFMETMFMPTVGIFSTTVVIVSLLLIRSKSRLNYMIQILEDQIKDLNGIALKISRIDKTISTSLENIRDKLRGLIGV